MSYDIRNRLVPMMQVYFFPDQILLYVDLHFLRLCCGYGNTGDGGGDETRGYDCLIIPGAMSKDGRALIANEFCGADLGLASQGSRTAISMGVQKNPLINKTICSK